MEVVTRETQLNIGDCLYYKNINSGANIHPQATYVGVITDIAPHVFTMRMKPIASTMGEATYLGNISRTYKSSLGKNLIETEGITLKRYDKDFGIDNPEKEAKLICEKNGVIFLKMIGQYGFLYKNIGISFGNEHSDGEVYEDDVRLFKMSDEFNK